jgi:hypothetical protein
MLAYLFSSSSSGPYTRVSIAYYDALHDNKVNIAQAVNCWNTTGTLSVVHQYNPADPAKPATGYDDEVVVYGPQTIPAGEYAEITLSSLGIKVTGPSDWYGDTSLTATGLGTLPAGGEVIIQLV